ncbi:MAG: hypothetical protein WC028_25620 [Candidatus Obscuribacterales bacterium]|jgi:hypothetical protein
MADKTSIDQKYVIKMSNGQGHVEWYMGLSVRTQALSPDEARHFTSESAAEAKATEITRESMLSAFSGAFFVDGRWVIETTVEPLS